MIRIVADDVSENLYQSTSVSVVSRPVRHAPDVLTVVAPLQVPEASPEVFL